MRLHMMSGTKQNFYFLLKTRDSGKDEHQFPQWDVQRREQILMPGELSSKFGWLDIFNNIPKLHIKVNVLSCDSGVTIVLLVVPSQFILAISYTMSTHNHAAWPTVVHGQETINDGKDDYDLNNDNFPQSVRSHHPELVTLPCIT